MSRQTAEPLGHQMRGDQLQTGMLTLQRYNGHDGEIHFRPDCLLVEELDSCGAGSRHFRTSGGNIVCYANCAFVFAKKLSDKEIESYGSARNHYHNAAMADTGESVGTVGDRRHGNNRPTKTPRRNRQDG